MATFRYDAVDHQGQRVKGEIEARRPEEARAMLAGQGLDVVSVRQRRRLADIQITPARVKTPELMHVSRQLAAFVRAGVPIVEAIDVIREETRDKTLAAVLNEVAVSLRQGESLSEALAPHEDAFPAFYLSVLRSAELTGHLDDVLDRLATYLERDLDARRKIRSALTYPVLVLFMAGISVAVMSVFVLPRFTTFFESFDAELPLPTRMLVAGATFFGRFGLFIPFLLLVAVVGAVLSVRTARGRMLRDRLLLALPAVGGVVRFSVTERFCRVLASMVRAGVPLPDSLHIAAVGAHNVVFERSLAVARDEMLEGQGLARPIARTKLFPRAVTQMLRVGEDTGTLDDQLESMATYYERELDHKIKRLTTLFEPAVMIVVGVVVGFVAIAMVSALYGIYQQVDIKS